MATYASIKYDFTPPTATVSAQVGAGAMVLIKSLTSDGSDDTLDFKDGTSGVVMDSTYKTYIFRYMDMHPETNNASFGVQFNASGGSGFDETLTTTSFRAKHMEDGSGAEVGYVTGQDLQQATTYQILSEGIGNVATETGSGELWLFNPSSTTYLKHFINRSSGVRHNPGVQDMFYAGYINTTSAIDEISFKFSSDEIQGGTINMYGIV